MAKIVLDPGHGGTKNIGGSDANHAVGPSGLLEKTITLDIAKRTAAELEALGHAVVLTRAADINLSLAARADVARKIKAPVFASIHFNGFNHVAQGTETFCHLDHSPQSANLCRAVQKAAVAATGLADRNAGQPGGVKSMALGVLNPARHFSGTACVLVEVSFMDVPAEDKRLQTEAYKNQVAKGLASGIAAYVAGAGMEGVSLETVGIAEVQDGFEAMARSIATESVAPSPRRKTAVQRGKPAKKSKPGPGASRRPGNDREEPMDGWPAGSESGVELEAVPTVPPAFQAFVDGLNLRYIKAAQLLFMGASNAGGKCGNKNTFPPKDLWPNIANTARMLDEIQHRLGYALRVNSGYRAPAYNTCIGGEQASLHMKFNAIDFTGAQDQAATWHAVAKSVRLSHPDFNGGIGFYRKKNFVHIDTRGSRSDWKGEGD